MKNETAHGMKVVGVTAASAVMIVALLVLMAMGLSQCASCQRFYKTVGSNVSGGIERTVTAYSYDGDVLGEWEGKIDYSVRDGRVLFDMEDGKRVSIVNGIVVTEEVVAEPTAEDGD